MLTVNHTLQMAYLVRDHTGHLIRRVGDVGEENA